MSMTGKVENNEAGDEAEEIEDDLHTTAQNPCVEVRSVEHHGAHLLDYMSWSR